jgi:hypothetical protein
VQVPNGAIAQASWRPEIWEGITRTDPGPPELMEVRGEMIQSLVAGEGQVKSSLDALQGRLVIFPERAGEQRCARPQELGQILRAAFHLSSYR